jgi:WD40 repeat protein
MLRRFLQKLAGAEQQSLEYANSTPDPPARAPAPFDIRLRCVLPSQKGKITRIAWSPDGRLLAAPADNRALRIWDVEKQVLFLDREGHSNSVVSAAWSPDGRMIVTGSYDQTARIWDVFTGNWQRTFRGHADRILSVAWSPDGRTIATGAADNTVRLYDTSSGALESMFQQEQYPVGSIAWSPNNEFAWGSAKGTIRIWDMQTKRLQWTLEGHTNLVLSMAWSPDGRTMASSSTDRTIQIWDIEKGRRLRDLEAHHRTVTGVSFSHDGRLLASKSLDDTVRIWRCDTWQLVKELAEPTIPSSIHAGIAFHPAEPVLATLGEHDTTIRIWDVNIEALLSTTPEIPSVHYRNAKVVLVGDSGVGKSGLGLVLSGKPFTATESTHGRNVWVFDSQTLELEGFQRETRETLLWDLAGQPGYRLIHQLYLNEVAVALIVIDTQRDSDPFMGVRYWDRALRQAQRPQPHASSFLKRFLIVARMDRGSGVRSEHLKTLVSELGLDGYFETSAKEGWGIDNLATAIRSAIDWESLPKVSSTKLFHEIKRFLIEEKQSGRFLCTVEDLYYVFLKSKGYAAAMETLVEQFETCIGRIESRGLVHRLYYDNLILLQPELLDAYASALVSAVKDEPDGLGCIAEANAQSGNFRIPRGEQIKDSDQERQLLKAMVEDLLHHEIALREQTEAGPQLVFPSQLTRERPDLHDPEGKAVSFSFEGSALNVYATLAVRLSYSGVFKKQDMWKNATIYTHNESNTGIYGIFLHEYGEGRGVITLFFDAASEDLCFIFETFVRQHLQRRVLASTIQRKRTFICLNCGTPVIEVAVVRRREKGFDWIECNVCQHRISLLDYEERLQGAVSQTRMLTIDRAIEARREFETADSVLQAKLAIGDSDTNILELIVTKRRRLHILETKQAYLGVSTLPETIMEIEDLRREIGDLESRLHHNAANAT